jgi:hypothetical protein
MRRMTLGALQAGGNMDTSKCIHCDGSGKEIASMDLMSGQIQYRTCGVCQGTGKVSADRSHFTEYPDRSLNIARQLIQQFGEPAEICIAGDHDIRVLFKNGSRYILGGFTVGYRGTGPDYTKAFLNASGFDISIDDIAEMRPPITLVAGQTYIPEQTLVFKSLTTEDAKKKALDAVPPNAKVIELNIIPGGTLKTVEGTGNTKESASENAKRLMPEEVEVEQEMVVREGLQGRQTVQSYSESDARGIAQKQMLKDYVITGIICKKPASKGFIGVGQRPGTYEVSWALPWKVAFKYREVAVARVRFQPQEK